MHSEASPVLSVIGPVYNEAEILPSFFTCVRDVMENIGETWELLLVDDGSVDGSTEIIKDLAEEDPHVRPVIFSRNFGHQIALSAGLDFALGDVVLMMDCDMQHPPQLIAEMVEQWGQGSDIVSAIRVHTEDASLFKRISSQGFYWLINRLSETRIAPGVADFCLLSKPPETA